MINLFTTLEKKTSILKNWTILSQQCARIASNKIVPYLILPTKTSSMLTKSQMGAKMNSIEVNFLPFFLAKISLTLRNFLLYVDFKLIDMKL